MKLMIAVIQQTDSDELMQHLTDQGVGVTHICSEGGFLREHNTTLLIATPESGIDLIMQTLQRHCATRMSYIVPLPPQLGAGEYYPAAPIEVESGGATVFVVPIEAFSNLNPLHHD